jgi:hypothetical protein
LIAAALLDQSPAEVTFARLSLGAAALFVIVAAKGYPPRLSADDVPARLCGRARLLRADDRVRARPLGACRHGRPGQAAGKARRHRRGPGRLPSVPPRPEMLTVLPMPWSSWASCCAREATAAGRAPHNPPAGPAPPDTARVASSHTPGHCRAITPGIPRPLPIANTLPLEPDGGRRKARVASAPEVSGCLVAPPVFKTGGRRVASPAGSIPVRLRLTAPASGRLWERPRAAA